MMLSLLIQKAFNNAASTWPSLKWPLESFQKHVAVDTAPKTAHLEDLYLAGSAGYREDSAWVVIEEEFGPKVQRVMEKKPKADLSVDDIWSQARL